MSAHADKTLHKKIYNINDTDTFSPHPFFKNVIFTHKSVKEFFMHEFKYEIRTNWYDFFARKIGYVTNGQCCTRDFCTDFDNEHYLFCFSAATW